VSADVVGIAKLFEECGDNDEKKKVEDFLNDAAFKDVLSKIRKAHFTLIDSDDSDQTSFILKNEANNEQFSVKVNMNQGKYVSFEGLPA